MPKHMFPETLFVKVENPFTEDECLATAKDLEEMAEIGETPVVAEYKLVRTRKVVTEVKFA